MRVVSEPLKTQRRIFQTQSRTLHNYAILLKHDITARFPTACVFGSSSQQPASVSSGQRRIAWPLTAETY